MSENNPYSSPSSTESSDNAQDVTTPRLGEQQVIWTIWMTYGAFYFCRTNISAALPGIEAEFGFTKLQMGIVLMSLKIAYAAGQFINGQLSERLRPRVMLAVGMLASAALNVIFGFGTAVYFFLFVWAMNGFMQSLGWTPCVRVIGNWVPVLRRGKAIGIVGTGYQLTAALTFVVVAFSVGKFGWRGAMFVPPVILTAAAIAMLVLLRETPEDTTSTSGKSAQQRKDATGSFLENLTITLANPALWLMGLALGMLNACRYGFLDWGITHLYEIEKDRLDAAVTTGLYASQQVLNKAVLKSAVKYAILPVGGIAGAFLSGWVTDRFFAGRRAPVICGLLVALGCLTMVYDSVARASFAGTVVLLACIGFTIYGPQVLLVGTAPADLARRGTSAAAAGFVNSMGYIGAAVLGDLLTGYLVKRYGWETAIYAWAGWAFLAAILVAFLWNRRGRGGRS